MKSLFFILTLFIFCIRANGNIYTVTDAGTMGGDQLKSFISDANFILGRDTILFSIPLTGVQTIFLDGVTTNITDPLYIDGFSQAGNDSATMSIRIRTDHGFSVQSGSCAFRGIYFLVDPTGTYRSCVDISSHLQSTISDISFINNIFDGFNTAVEIIYDPQNIVTLSDFYFFGNTFLNIQYGVTTAAVAGYVYFDFTFSYNSFNHSPLALDMPTQIPDNNFNIDHNTFSATSFNTHGTIRQLTFENNTINANGSLGFYFGNINNFTIKNNLFKRDNGGISIFSGGDDIRIEQNNFEASSQLPIQIIPDRTMRGIRINRNTFMDIRGIALNFSPASATTRFDDLTISENTFAKTTVSNVDNYISIDVGGTAGFCHLDSVVVRSNILHGGAISFVCGLTIGSDSLTHVVIDSNTVTGNNNINSGIRIQAGSNSKMKDITITNNTIDSFDEGIFVRTVVAFGYYGYIYDVDILNNVVTGCVDGILVSNSVDVNTNGEVINVAVNGNKCYNNTGDGIRLVVFAEHPGHINRFQSVSVSNNSIHDNGLYGIHFQDYGLDSISVSPVFDHISYSQNSIYNNGLKGIWNENVMDINGPVTPFYPVPEILTVNINTNILYGRIYGDTLTSYIIELFGNSNCDSSGAGEGEFYLNDVTCATDNSGLGIFQINMPGNLYPYYSLTATSLSDGNTSVFSNCADSATGIANVMDVEFNLYPNPAGDFCIVSNLKHVPKEIFLYSMSGGKLNVFSRYKDGRIDLTGISAGVYQLIFDGVGKRIVKY